jgi:hypothetical protein
MVFKTEGSEAAADLEGQLYIEWLEAYADYFDDVKIVNEEEGKQASETSVNIPEDDHDEESCNRSIAKIFMKGMLGDEEILPYRDQVDVVVEFAEQQPTSMEFEKAVALLDDRNSSGTHPPRNSGGRLNWGPFTPTELREELSKQVTTFSLVWDITNMSSSASKLIQIKLSLQMAITVTKETLKGGFCKL